MNILSPISTGITVMGWKSSKLGDVCEMIKRGVAPKYAEEGGICVLNQKCVRDHSVNHTLARRHDIEVKKVNLERYIKVGDVLVNSTGTGTLGRVAQVRIVPPERTTVDTHVTIVRPKPDLFHCDFFGYMLIKIEEEITAAGEGASGQTELARAKLENEFFVSYPDSIPEQKRIVAILDQVFADIEQARAKTEQNLKNALELYLSKKSKIFENLQADAKLIPLPSVCDEIFAGGDAPKKGLFSKSKTERFQIPIYANAVKCNGLYGFTDFSRANKPSITIAARGSGTGHIELRREPFLPIVRLIVLTPDKEVMSLEYLKQALQNLDILRSGSAIPQLTIPMIKEYSVPLPSLDIQQSVIDELERLDDYVRGVRKIYEQKLVLLTELKKSILQKAFTGKLTRADKKPESKGAAA